MKLAAVLTVLLLAGVAHAGPGGPRAANQRPMRAMLLARFDRNHDGRLEPRERKKAARALRRLARRLQRGGHQGNKRQRIIQRYDVNGDGNVGPAETPPGVANRLRPLDQNGDGWVDGDEMP